MMMRIKAPVRRFLNKLVDYPCFKRLFKRGFFMLKINSGFFVRILLNQISLFLL